jgi:hypothetical protein
MFPFWHVVLLGMHDDEDRRITQPVMGGAAK